MLDIGAQMISDGRSGPTAFLDVKKRIFIIIMYVIV